MTKEEIIEYYSKLMDECKSKYGLRYELYAEFVKLLSEMK